MLMLINIGLMNFVLLWLRWRALGVQGQPSAFMRTYVLRCEGKEKT